MLIEEFFLDKLGHDAMEYFSDNLAAVLCSFTQLVFSLFVGALLVQPIAT